MNFLLIMAISASINIADTATPTLTALQNVMKPRAIAANIGEAEVLLFQNHFRNAPPNKYGYPSTGFWKGAVRATNYTATDAGVTINVNQVGVRQRYQGGDIYPTGGRKYLAIPARAEAYGKAPGEFNNLQLAFRRTGGRVQAFALVEAAATQIKLGRKNKSGQRSYDTQVTGGGVYFWLVKHVHQNPDPSVIPDRRDMMHVAKETMDDIVERVSKNGGAA